MDERVKKYDSKMEKTLQIWTASWALSGRDGQIPMFWTGSR